MSDTTVRSDHKSFGSTVLDQMVERLRDTPEPRKRYEYVLWLAKKLHERPQESFNERHKVKGCISQVYVEGKITNGMITWEGFSDALITRGLLALLIRGLNNLSPQEVIAVDQGFITATGLQGSLTASRANGFLNIFLNMQAQAKQLAMQETLSS